MKGGRKISSGEDGYEIKTAAVKGHWLVIKARSSPDRKKTHGKGMRDKRELRKRKETGPCRLGP